jgi:quercetin dioxygenase-like cupin family protein
MQQARSQAPRSAIVGRVDNMDRRADGYIVPPDQGSVYEREQGRPTMLFKLLSEQTGERVAVFEEVIPGGFGTPLHRHHTSDELIYILAGDFSIKIGEQMSHAGAGTWIFIGRGTAHAWKNRGDAAGRACFIFTPAEGAKVFEAMSRLGKPRSAIDPATLEQLRTRYGYELVGPPL